jgi:NAD(P)-dependent dehydrogenase (short-subunit alcohol dehydrogenase family)
MDGKVCLVTGANSGIGKAAALALARSGATVVMACRDRARGEAAADEIRQTSGSAMVELLLVDLSIRRSVRDAAAQFLQRHNRLDTLINNAAAFKSRRVETPDGLETMFATNHLGHFLLTTLLLDRLKASAPSRIVNVTAPSTVKVNFDDPQSEKKFRASVAFGASKMCNLLFTYELARRLEGTGVTCNALHPGLARSNLLREMPRLIRWGLTLVSAPPERAAQAVVFLAFSPDMEGVTGKFFKGSREISSDDYSRDAQVQRRLWELSETLVNSV